MLSIEALREADLRQVPAHKKKWYTVMAKSIKLVIQGRHKVHARIRTVENVIHKIVYIERYISTLNIPYPAMCFTNNW